MILFLTSSPTGPLDGSRKVDGLDRKNRFVENLRERWRSHARCLIIAAAPEEYARNDEMRSFFAGALARSGLPCSAFDLWDDRTDNLSVESLHNYDVIFLSGGHVPTQNAFFQAIGLREKLHSFDGIVIGISAGTMNAAELVYAQPELPGESVDPAYRRWLPGLGLTTLNLLPHYQMVKDGLLDGRQLFEDITYADSTGHMFWAIPDGSYVLVEQGRAALWDEGWSIAYGHMKRVSTEGGVVRI